MKSTPRVSGDRSLIVIRYKYISQKFLGFIATEGNGINEPGVPYLSSYPENYSNVSIPTVLWTHVIGSCFRACSKIDNHNRILQSDISL